MLYPRNVTSCFIILIDDSILFIFMFSIFSAAEPKIYKLPRIQAPEFSLGNIPYNFIKDKHVFTTDGATLRLVRVLCKYFNHFSKVPEFF